jgi:two-component system response regulator DctR
MKNYEPTVFVIDDDEAVLESLTLLLKSVGIPVKTYLCCREFLGQYEQDIPGCLVVDVRMSEMSGIELQNTLLQNHIDIPIIFISGHGDILMAVEAIKKGAIDFLVKPFREQALLDIINKALLKDAEIRKIKEGTIAFEKMCSSLTERELEVMKLLITGKTNKNIARILNIGVKTVDFHRVHILDKLGVDSVVELMQLLPESRSFTLK